MRVLLISQYFWPESFIINDLVKILVSQGHSVEVLTGKPNYPDGKVFEGYSAKECMSEFFDKTIKVHRIPTFPRGAGGKNNLLRNYFTFVFNGLKYFHKMVKGEGFDVILVYMPSPITQVIPAIYLKLKMKIHLAVWVQDLWPESLKATGFIKNPLLIGLVGVLVRGIYWFSDTLLIQSRAFREPISRYTSPEKIVYYPNSYLDPKGEAPKHTKVPPEVLDLLESYFCLVFAGNLGTAQSLETIVQAAEKLIHLPKIKIVIVGSGSKGDWLKQQVIAKGLDNLELVGRYPASEMPQFFSRSAGLLVTLKKEEIFAYTIPSKIQAYLAAGRPVIAALDGEGAKVLKEAGAGLSCPAEDADRLAKCIERFYNMPQIEQDKLGSAGRAYYLQHFEMNRQSHLLVELLEDRIQAERK